MQLINRYHTANTVYSSLLQQGGLCGVWIELYEFYLTNDI